jgi:hypothetical protein
MLGIFKVRNFLSGYAVHFRIVSPYAKSRICRLSGTLTIALQYYWIQRGGQNGPLV